MSKKPREAVSDDANVKFGDAMKELETILAKLDQDDVDLDDLAGMVERAASLIRLCRDRITRTEMQVRRIIDELDEPDGEDDTAADDELG